MNTQLQLELWAECRCNRCKFCNLHLNSVIRGDSEHDNPNTLLSPKEKTELINRALSFLFTVDWSKYDTLLIRGGEVFNDPPQEIIPTFLRLLDEVSSLIFKGTVTRLFLITSLKYPFDTSLLKASLEYLVDKGLGKEKILVGTSWDPQYRFTKASEGHWWNNYHRLQEDGIPVHVTSILTQNFIEKFLRGNSDVHRLMQGSFDFIPAQGKPELLCLEGFFPKRDACMKFLSLLREDERYRHVWKGLFNQHKRRAESIYMTALQELQVRDLKDYTAEICTRGTLKCGHPLEYANYEDSNACFLCDLNILSKTG